MTANAPFTASPGRRWLRRLVVVTAVLLITVYFTFTSEWFLKSQILPRASKSLGATITVEHADIHPFSLITLRGLKVQADVGEPLLQAPMVRASIRLRDLLAGRVTVSEIVITHPVVRIVKETDGSFNFNRLQSATGSRKSTPVARPARAAAPSRIEITSVAINNAVIHITRHSTSRATEQATLPRLEISLNNVRDGAGQFAFQFPGLNQDSLRPFLRTSAEGLQLDAVFITATGAGRFDTRGTSTFNMDIAMTNLVVRDPRDASPPVPLRANVVFDGSMRGSRLDALDLRLLLPPTPRVANQLQLTGSVDFTDTNALAASLTLTGNSVDVTLFYDLFNNASKLNKTAEAAGAGGEPAPVKLGYKNTTLDVNIRELFLREVAVSNFTTTVKADGSRVQVRPLAFVLNGASVSAAGDFNLGVTGWEYDVTLKADRIPIEPLANTFTRDYKGQANGDLYADLHFKGAGTTGANLRRSLEGHALLSFTNANIRIVGKKLKPIVSMIASALGTLDILQSPINHLNAYLRAGDGKIEVRRFYAHSPAMIGESRGVIPITDVFTNSPLEQPVEVWLPRELAKRFSLGALAPDSAAYVKLPQFATLNGTLARPGVDLDKFKLAEIGAGRIVGAGAGVAVETVKGAAGVVKEVGKGLGKTIESIGDALLGKKPGDTNAPPPSVTGTNNPSRFNPFKLIPVPTKP